MMVKFILLAVVFLAGCAGSVSIPATRADSLTPASPTPEIEVVSKPELDRKPDGSFLIPTPYWANPRSVAAMPWHAVFGGTVIEVKNDSQKFSRFGDRKFISGALRVEKIFRNLPDSSEITVGSVIGSEDFDGLKKGDKAIFFVNEIYEGGFVRIEIEGTNSKLGFKVQDWNDPIVAVLEKLAPCDKTTVVWVEGHPEDFKAKLHACERESKILDDPQIAEIWKRYDPRGFQSLVEFREFRETDDN